MINKIPLGIKSCEKNNIRRLAIQDTWLKELGDQFFPMFLIGRPNQPTELIDNILYLNCDDTYANLVGKMKEFYRWILQNSNCEYFWTCDDDSYINCKVFNNYNEHIGYDYCGNFLYGLDIKLNLSTDIDIEVSGADVCGYASGCTVCLSKRAAKICAEKLPYVGLPYIAYSEDVATGRVLNDHIKDLKKLHMNNIFPWSNIRKYDNLLAGHYIYHTIAGDPELNNYQSMKKMHYLYYKPDLNEKIDYSQYLTGRLNRKFNSIKEKETIYLVEKNIHFIWIGSKIPEKYIKNILKCKKLNLNYIINVWLDNEFPEELVNNNIICHNINIFKSIHEELLNTITAPAAKADILSYEIVYRNGGIYSDVDAIFVKSFDDNFNNSFVSHIHGYYNICHGCFGFNKGSKFLKFVLDCFPENFCLSGKDAWLPELSGPTFFTTCFVQYNDKNINTLNQEFLINNNNYSYCYHTNDKNW